MHGRFRVAASFIVEAFAQGIHLNAAFHDESPSHERTLRRDPRSVTLVSIQIAHLQTQLTPPLNGSAVVALMTRKHSVGHFRQQLFDHFGVATKTIASQQYKLAGDMFYGAIGPDIAHTQNLVVRVDPQLTDPGLTQDIGAQILGHLGQSGHEGRTRFFGHGVHAPHTVARV